MRIINLEFMRFIVVGTINTFNYYLIYLFMHSFSGLNYILSHIISFLISMIISFFLNTHFTFQVRPSIAKFIQFPLTQLFNIIVSSLLVYSFVEYLQMDSTIAPLLSIFITVPLTFIITGKILKK